MILVSFQDYNGEDITELDFGEVMQGAHSPARTLVLNNTGDEDAPLILSSALEDEDEGREVDTVKSTFISKNGDRWYQTLGVTVPAGEALPVYVKWMPPSDGTLGECLWSLNQVIGIEEVPDLSIVCEE